MDAIRDPVVCSGALQRVFKRYGVRGNRIHAIAGVDDDGRQTRRMAWRVNHADPVSDLHVAVHDPDPWIASFIADDELAENRAVVEAPMWRERGCRVLQL